ncbi:MAG: hypothetical protein JWM27_99 [Gemmatimonadetes bacterium]|nr:hypothetical protein [Gemmatimonadota bacterium]
MSTGEKIPLARARRIADRAAAALAPAAAEVHVAGSVRRERPFVGDVELVVVPRMIPDGLFGDERPDLDSIRAVALLWGKIVRSGDRLISVDAGEVKVELYLCHPPAQLGSILAIRTGPAEFGALAMQRLARRGYRHRDGHVVDGAGQIVPTPTEEEFFRLAGLPCLPPVARSAVA